MGKEEKRILALDQYEHGVVINALNDMRNDLIEEERPHRHCGRGASEGHRRPYQKSTVPR